MTDVLDLIRRGKIKRFFRATRKLNAPNLVSHITQRAAGKEPLFVEEEDYLLMLGNIREVAEKYALRILAFCLMPNHVHLLLSPTEANLYDAMRDLFSRYAMGFNRRYERKGHLFGGPYRQAICLDDSYLLAASLYIHLNPVKAGLSNESVGYRWSSVRLYTDESVPDAFVDSEFILGMLPEKGRGRETYGRLLKQGEGIEVGHILEQEDAIERFNAKLVKLFPGLFKRIGNKRHVAAASGIDILSSDNLEAEIRRLKEGGLLAKVPETRKARKFIIEQLISRGYKRKEIAEKLGLSRKTVYNILKTKHG